MSDHGWDNWVEWLEYARTALRSPGGWSVSGIHARNLDVLVNKEMGQAAALRAAARAYLDVSDVEGHNPCGCTWCIARAALEALL